MTALARMTRQPADARRRGVVAMVLDQVGYAARELWRSRIVLIFTFVLPLVWLVLIGFMAGNEMVDAASGVRVMQFATPMAAVMGLLFSAYPPVANSLALAREQKITKRLRGTPLPMWAYLLGRVGAAVLLAAVSVVVMLAIGVIAYGVQLQARTAIATVVTLGLGVGCLAAIGLAVGALAPSAAMAQTFSIASAVVVSFLSGMMTMGLAAPAWMETVAAVFPVKHLLRSLQGQFDPFASGAGWDLVALAVLAAWGAAGILVAAWALRREPRSAAAPAVARDRAAAHGGLRATAPGRPSPMALVLDQNRWASTAARRDAGWVFFAVGMPVGLYALMASQMGGTEFQQGGVPFALFFAVGMAVYGAAVTAFMNMPEAVATARDRGLLKRLRGTPLAPWQYLAGRTTSVLWIGILTGILVFATGILAFGVTVPAAAVPLALAVFLLGTLTLAACGYALAAVAPSGRAMGVIGLAILLPLSFLSNIFPVGGAMPDLLTTLGAVFPLRHFVEALTAAVHPDGPSVAWANLAVMSAWLIAASFVAVRRFSWQPRR
jgi:ABC-type multidrug transport system permease subunit